MGGTTTTAEDTAQVFDSGTEWVRADFHLHTKADKEFSYTGDANSFAAAYVDALKKAEIRVGVIANHNKFDMGEYKALRSRAGKEGIGLLPGVELSVSDGANGVHTLIVFSDKWLEGGHDFINSFLASAFMGRVPAQYEQENGRSNNDLLTTLKDLDAFHRDFFVVFAHVEAASGLWNEIDGGRLQELSSNPLVQKYCLAFQKVRTHDKPDAKCRVKVQGWWQGRYPAEVEGCDAKKLTEIGRGRKSYLKIGDLTFDAVRYALSDREYRVAAEVPKVEHSHINAIRFEGGMLNGVRVPFSPHLNCIIGTQGSGKSSVLECLRFALTILPGEKDKEYKNALVAHVLKSGGKVVVEATDRHGTRYEIGRILNHQADVRINGKLQSNVSIREVVLRKPLYFGQKDLSDAGRTFGTDLVEKLVGETLKPVRQKVQTFNDTLKKAAGTLLAVQDDLGALLEAETALNTVNLKLEQFDKHGVDAKLEKQIAFNADATFCGEVDSIAQDWLDALNGAIDETAESFEQKKLPESKHNADFFNKYDLKFQALKQTLVEARALAKKIEAIQTDLCALHDELDATKDGLKDEFAEVERQLVEALKSQGVTSIEPDDYVELKDEKTELTNRIADLSRRTAKESERRDALLQVLSERNAALLEEFQLIVAELGKINKAQGSLKVSPVFKGDKAAFRAQLEQAFGGSGIRKDSYQELANNYEDFGEIFRDLDNAASITKGKSETFKDLFAKNLTTLLTYQVPNSYDVTYRNKPLKSHSLGQRASAMMVFLLSQDENDVLLIDQPEDDLDSQTVYDEVVRFLRDIKVRRQFIFVTHNANFPVLGDAESITACHTEDDVATALTGSIDSKESQDKIVKIMEGGKDAFERRRVIYQVWNTA
jgi:energy-coupling factor transporter ATP-binding protein EcfA2